MAKESYYAVKVGKIPGIYLTWEQCQEQTKGFSGAQFQKFSNMEDAEAYLQEVPAENSAVFESNDGISKEEFNAQVNQAISQLTEEEIIAFVDGSFDATAAKSAFGVIVFSHNNGKDTLYKSFSLNQGEEFISLRNVAAELEGVKEAVNWAIKYNKKRIAIYYDYSGIEQWATGAWKANNSITRAYVSFIHEKRNFVEMNFIKVPAHHGIEHNEEADAIAKKALLAKGHKTYNDGSVYFVGYGLEDWNTIVQCINEENEQLSSGSISSITISTTTIDKRKRIVVQQNHDTVTINCYGNSKSYVQGKQTVLFQKIISTAIGLLSNKQIVIETLNSYHALTLKDYEVENKFEQLLPHYRSETDKHYANLLSAVYNTMLTGYMPDYTCLVMPLFRAFEFYLHRILGDVMLLSTTTNSGTNNFAFFSKDASGGYVCNSKETNRLSVGQLQYLNSLYTRYNSVRHPYSHWSASDVDTAVLTEMSEARQIILDGLELINQYYTLF